MMALALVAFRPLHMKYLSLSILSLSSPLLSLSSLERESEREKKNQIIGWSHNNGDKLETQESQCYSSSPSVKAWNTE